MHIALSALLLAFPDPTVSVGASVGVLLLVLLPSVGFLVYVLAFSLRTWRRDKQAKSPFGRHNLMYDLWCDVFSLNLC